MFAFAIGTGVNYVLFVLFVFIILKMTYLCHEE